MITTALTREEAGRRQRARMHLVGRDASLKLERTTDENAIRSVIAHPEVMPDIWDLPGEPPVFVHESIFNLIAREERHADGAVHDDVVGVCMFIPVNGVTWNPHVAVLPHHRGKGTEMVRLAMQWMYAHTPCRKLVAYPPAFNTKMIRVFEKCGFAVEGHSPNSFPWRGAIYDRVLMGAEKGD